eukprot:25439_1
MGKWMTLCFTIISFFCAILLILSFIHFSWGVNQRKKGKSVDPLIKKCAFISLLGYTIFVVISFALYLIQSLYYIPSIHIAYSTVICQAQTFNIVFFMIGKLAMYFYFMALVHVAFRGSFLSYSVTLIGTMAFLFSLLMCSIGAFYMVFLYMDFSSVGPIDSPSDCDKFEASEYSKIAIWTGATCDAIWSFTCLLLFYLRLRKITKLMIKQHKLERKETNEMIQRIESNKKATTPSSKTNTESKSNPYASHHPQAKIDRLEAVYVPALSISTSLTCTSIESAKTQHTFTSSSVASTTKVLPVLNEEKTHRYQVALSPSTSACTTPTETHIKDTKHDTTSRNMMLDMNHSHSDESVHDEYTEDEDSMMTLMTDDTSTVQSAGTQTVEYTLMRNKYQNAPCIVPYDSDDTQSSSGKMLTSLKLKFDNTSSKIKRKIKRRNSWALQRKQRTEKKKPDIVHKFLPIMLKLSILSAWCAFSTFGL